MFSAVHIADSSEAIRIIFFMVAGYAFLYMSVLTIKSFIHGKGK